MNTATHPRHIVQPLGVALSMALAASAIAFTPAHAASAPPAARGPEHAAAQRIAELEAKLEKSLQMLDAMGARITQLESQLQRQAAVGTGSATGEVQAQEQSLRIDQLERTVAQVSADSVQRASAGLPLHGFFDVGYAHSSNNPSGVSNGFFVGNLDFYMTPDLGERVKGLAELVFEVGEDGTLATDLERLQLGYLVSDAMTVWIGRFHTPYGYWNTAFHHGAQLQTSLTRPRFIDFEDRGGILPAHTVGVVASGAVNLGGGKLKYDTFVGNGGRIIDGVLDFNAFRDDNNNKALGGNVRYTFDGRLDGLTLGLHGLTERIATYDAGGLAVTATRLRMFGGFAHLETGAWDVLSELYRFSNEDLSGNTGTHSSWAAFVQAGRTFGEVWTPFVRFEKAVLDQTDNYFHDLASGRSYRRDVIGLRYDVSPLAALKLELNHTQQQLTESETSANEARFQFAVRF